MNLTKDGWKLSELKTEKRQLNRQFKNAKRRHDILQMEAINYRLKIVEAQIDRLMEFGDEPPITVSRYVGVSQYFAD
jgi:hypothetical protein